MSPSLKALAYNLAILFANSWLANLDALTLKHPSLSTPYLSAISSLTLLWQLPSTTSGCKIFTNLLNICLFITFSIFTELNKCNYDIYH